MLDVGCGTGVVALTAARFGAKATGVDDYAIRRAVITVRAGGAAR